MLRTHLDEARKESGFLDAVRNVEKLQNGEQLAETHHKAHRVKGVGQSICSQKQQAVCWMLISPSDLEIYFLVNL